MVAINVSVTENLIELLPDRVYRKVARQAWQKIGNRWQKKHRPRHFTLYGARLYDYTPRKPGYNRSKRRRSAKLSGGGRGIALPLVYSGRSRLLSRLGKIQVQRRGGNYGVKITSPVRAFNFRPKRSQIDMRREYSEIADSEKDEYEQILVQELERAIQQRQRRRTSRRRVR